LKTLRVIARLNVGGPARHVVLLDAGLRRKGWDTLLVHGAVGPGEASLECLADEQRIPRLRLRELGPRLNAFSDLTAFWRILRLIFREQPDVVHTHTAKAGALGRTAAAVYNATRPRKRRAAIVHTFHGHVLDGYFGPLGTAAVRAAERSLGWLSDRIVTISRRQRDDMVNRFRIAPAGKVVTIPLGLDLTELLSSGASTALRDRLGIPREDFVVGFVGRFVPIKDLATALSAFAAMRQHVPRAWFLLAGDGPLRPELQAQARALGIGDQVKFLGWTERLADFYNAIDVCVLSSLNEGTPVAAIEAMAAGKVVVATAVGGVPDLIADGRTGVLVPPRAVETLADVLAAIARDASARRRLGEAAKLDVAARFSVDRLVSDIDHLYRQGLAKKRGTIVAAR
jgi:glycosyltransferase involved in cell wall biosynthesis